MLLRILFLVVSACIGITGYSRALDAEQRAVFETSFTSSVKYRNAFTEMEVNVVFRQGEKQWKVPAFWTGDKNWTVRFAPPFQGKYTYRVECTDKANSGLNGKEQTLSVAAYKGDNQLLKHGFVQVSPDKGYFTHEDGTPFLWLADTWWKCLCKRMTWVGFQELTADRKAKGFNVVQIVCGPYPDENFFAPSLENEGGQPYLANDMSVVNPKYFDYADRRFRHLVDAGIVPAIVGAWGRGDCNSMEKFGAVNIKRHWRYLIARYSAYPVFWILAGEIADETKWGKGPWAEVAKYVREIDPYKHPLTCHTGQGRRGAEGDEYLIDYDMVGGNHDEREAVANGTLNLLTSAIAKKPAMPVLCGETCYEGHMQQGFGDVQRHILWRNMLSGAAGHTYGAAGVWHAGVEGDHGNWGAWDRQPYDWTTWKQGMNYPGSTQLGIAKKLLEQYPWSHFVPHPEWVENNCFAAGIPGEVRFIYLPRRNIYNWDGPEVKNLEPDVDWHVYYFDPATGRTFDQGTIKATAKAGDKDAKPVSFRKNVPSPQDWVLVFEAVLKGSSQSLGGVGQDWKSMMTIAERKYDAQGNLLPLQSYDETIRRGMDFLLQDHLKWFKGPSSMLLDEKGQQQPPWVYYSNLQQDGTPFEKSVDRFVSYPAFHHALAIRTFLAYWKYSGDNTSLREAIGLADWNIAHSTPADWAYGSLPYSTFQEGKPGGFRDKTGLMPDKAAIMALAYLRVHEATHEARFLQAAEAIGMTLSKKQRPDGTWPFRVDPRTETVIENYTSSVIYAVMLFETLDRLNGNHNYRANRDLAWDWLLNGPVRNKDFRGFYEDIADQPTNRTNYDCLDVIRYLLANRTDANGYLDLARELNDWIEKVFLDKIQGFEPAEGIREQLECNVVMGIHSLNWASMLLELSKATGDEHMRQRAIQTANYITYYLQPDNRIVVGFTYEQWWYSCHMGPVLYLLDFARK